MKSILFSQILLVTLIFGCSSSEVKKTSTEIGLIKAENMQQVAYISDEFDFQKIHVPHNYALSTDNQGTLDNSKAGMKEFDARRDFIASSGFPIADPFTLPTAANYDWRQWDARFHQFVAQNQGSKYLPIFRRIGSIIILKDMGLLGKTGKDEKEKIAFYTKQLLDNGGANNTALMYYSLKALEGVWSEEEIQKYAKTAIVDMEHDPFTQRIRPDVSKMRAMRLSGEAPELDTVFITKLEKLLKQQEDYRLKLASL